MNLVQNCDSGGNEYATSATHKRKLDLGVPVHLQLRDERLTLRQKTRAGDGPYSPGKLTPPEGGPAVCKSFLSLSGHDSIWDRPPKDMSMKQAMHRLVRVHGEKV